MGRDMKDQKNSGKKQALAITQAAMVEAIYVVLTYLFAPISFGAVQFRIAEALTILPMYTWAAVPGLFVGCLLGNILGGAGAFRAVTSKCFYGDVTVVFGNS